MEINKVKTNEELLEKYGWKKLYWNEPTYGKQINKDRYLEAIYKDGCISECDIYDYGIPINSYDLEDIETILEELKKLEVN